MTNNGARPHELDTLPVDPGTAEQQFLDANAKPDAQFNPVGGDSILSPGQIARPVIDLAPGTYAAACFMPFQWEGGPHAFMGMVKIFTAQ